MKIQHLLVAGLMIPVLISGAQSQSQSKKEIEYLPDRNGAKTVSVSKDTVPAAEVLVLTQGIAIKETGPKQTVRVFGEVYSYTPAFIAVHRDEPTTIRFWNLQPDDDHDFMLIDPRSNVLMKVVLPALKETSYVFIFHQEGLFNFYCTVHRPAMNGQILVLPPRPKP